MTVPLPLLAVFTPFAAALLAPFLAPRLGARAGWPLALAFLPGLALLSLVAPARAGTPATSSLVWVPGIDLEIALRADGFSLLFALIVALVGALVTLYASAYLGSKERHGRFYSYLLLFGGAMMGFVLADNLVALFAFWELTSIVSFLLIGFWDYRRASQDGAVKSLMVTAVGGLALLVAVILLGLAGGSGRLSELDFAAVRESPSFAPIMVLVLLAAFTKSAQLPFHLWLPTAMEAPTPISAYLHSATMVKAGVVLLAKFSPLFIGTSWSGLVLYVGLATMFWGAYLAVRQSDLKALLAYSTISQLGILTALYGAGYPFAATAHLINHAAFKAALFLIVGAVDHQTGSRDVHKLSGLRRRLPLTFALALPAALSMAGLPPFGGFISKELFYEEMLHEGFLPILIAVTGSVMTFTYSLKFLSVFFGPYRCEKPEVREASVGFLLPTALLGLGVVLFGVFPFQGTFASPLTNLAAPALGFEPDALYLWHGFTLGLGLSALTWGLGFGLYLVRGRFIALQKALTPSWNANTVYYGLIEALERFSSLVTRRTQNATFATHLRLLWLPVALSGMMLGGRYLPPKLSPVPLEFSVAALLVVAGSFGVLVARTRLAALIFTGLTGLSATAVFVMLRAPDLALTQLLIETVTVILFLAVFRHLPTLTRYRRSGVQVGLDALLATAVGGTVFSTLLAVQTPLGARIRDYFLENSKTEGGGYNVVNVILVDFRGFDTLGEITVLAIVGVTVYALLKIRTAPLRPRKEDSDER